MQCFNCSVTLGLIPLLNVPSATNVKAMTSQIGNTIGRLRAGFIIGIQTTVVSQVAFDANGRGAGAQQIALTKSYFQQRNGDSLRQAQITQTNAYFPEPYGTHPMNYTRG